MGGESQISWFNVSGKIVLLIILIYFSFQLFFTPRPWIFIDPLNLMVHETGHLVFAFGGQTIAFLGGSLFQTLTPFFTMLYFIYKGQYFGTLFGLFWVGENLVNVSVYIKDAQTMTLPLLFGGIHDWNWLLTHWGLLEHDQLIGGFIYYFGVIFILTSLILMGVIIYLDIKRRLSQKENLEELQNKIMNMK